MHRRMTRAERNAQTRRLLLDAARRLFVARGFHATSLADVAAEAGFTKGAVFSQFEGKADLFLALMEARSRERIEAMETLRFDRPDAATLAAALAADWTRNQSLHREWSLLVIEFRVYAARNPAVAKRYAKLHARLRDAIVRQYRRHLARANVETTLELCDVARAALAISHGVLLEELAEPGFDAERVVRTLALGLVRDKGDE